jgi:hypothetical protein
MILYATRHKLFEYLSLKVAWLSWELRKLATEELLKVEHYQAPKDLLLQKQIAAANSEEEKLRNLIQKKVLREE